VTQPLLVVRDLVTSFPTDIGSMQLRANVVDGVSLDLVKGEVLALVGESGSGKSVTALSVMRLIPKPGRIDRGRIKLSGVELLRLSVPEMRRMRGGEVSMIFQEPMTSLNPVVRVGDQVVEAIRLHEKISRRAALARTLELFERVSIPDAKARLRAYPHELSGGLKQRVMIAMALCANPQVLIADEPTTALDVTIQAQTLDLLRELKDTLGMAILLITHDFGIVNELADNVAVMYAGRIVEKGTREEILSSPRHPYTQGLLRSMPALAKRGEPLEEIEGTVPLAGEWPEGCRFATRCKVAYEFCAAEAPALSVLSPTHRCWCHAVTEQESRS